MKNFKNKKGITLIETLMAISIISILLVLVLPSFSSIKKNNILKSSAEDVLSALDQAHSQTLSSVNSSVYGVHFQADQVIIFKGTSYSSNDSNNKIIYITTPATISNVTLNNSSSTTGDVYFTHLTGVPNKTGTITVSTSNGSKIITISVTGSFSVN